MQLDVILMVGIRALSVEWEDMQRYILRMVGMSSSSSSKSRLRKILYREFTNAKDFND